MFYNNVLVDLFNVPLINSKSGKLLYAGLVPVWWTTAFIIAAAVPDFFGFNAIISASTLLNLTYTLPPLIALGYDIQRNSMPAGQRDGFDPATGEVKRQGTTMQRHIRGFTSGGRLQVAINVWHVIYFLASLAMCVLGMYASIQGYVSALPFGQVATIGLKAYS